MNEPDLHILPNGSFEAMRDWTVEQALPCACGRSRMLADLLAGALKFNGSAMFGDPAVWIACDCGREDRLQVWFARGVHEEAA